MYNLSSNRLPYDSPPTPMTGLPVEAEDCKKSNRLLHDLITKQGYTIMATEEKEGRLIHDVIPIQGKEQDYSNEGSSYFPFHVEVPHYAIADRPDAIAFLCVRGCAQAKTLLIDVAALNEVLKSNMTARDYALLFEPIFYFKEGVSFGHRKEHCTAIFHETDNGLEATLDLSEMYGKTAEAGRVLNKITICIDNFYASLVTEVSLKRGDFLLFDNKKMVHARNNYSEAVVYDGTQRWLKRVYLKK